MKLYKLRHNKTGKHIIYDHFDLRQHSQDAAHGCSHIEVGHSEVGKLFIDTLETKKEEREYLENYLDLDDEHHDAMSAWLIKHAYRDYTLVHTSTAIPADLSDKNKI